jgi:hypothetical protein
MRPNHGAVVAEGKKVWLVVGIQSKNINTNGAVINVQAKPYTGAAPTTWTAADETIIAKKAADGDKIIYGSLDVTPASTASNASWADGVAIAANVVSCASCSKSGDFKLTAFLAIGIASDCKPMATGGGNMPVNVDDCILQPYPLKDNSFTWDYELGVNAFGAAAYTTQPADFVLFANIDVQGTGSASISLVYSMDMPFKNATKANGAIPAVLPAGVQVVPRGSPRSGDFKTGGLPLGMGKWYVQPFVNNAGTGGGKAPFDIAFGINHEPSAAGVAMPSLLIAAILSAVAMLF